MKKFGVYSAIWAIVLGIFNLIVFLTPNEAGDMYKFGGAFWVGYIAITVAFVAQLVCALFALREKNQTKLFYNIPLIKISYTGLVIMLIAGTLCMAIPNLPNWIGIIACALVLLFNAIALIKASAAARVVAGIDEKVAAETSFIKGLTAEAELLTPAMTCAPPQKRFMRRSVTAIPYRLTHKSMPIFKDNSPRSATP